MGIQTSGEIQESDEDTFWAQEGRPVMRDFIGGNIYKGGYFGRFSSPEDTQKFWAFLDARPLRTVQEYYSGGGYSKTGKWEDSRFAGSTIVNCPNKIREINELVALINKTRQVDEYKRLINRLILIAYPDAKAKGSIFHRDI